MAPLAINTDSLSKNAPKEHEGLRRSYDTNVVGRSFGLNALLQEEQGACNLEHNVSSFVHELKSDQDDSAAVIDFIDVLQKFEKAFIPLLQDVLKSLLLINKELLGVVDFGIPNFH